MKKALTLVMILGLVSVFATETVQPAPVPPTKVEKTVVKVEKVEKKAEGQVKKEAKRDANKM
ncbi:hypothetical protein [Sulfuricurvum sp.]|uniref:hypothetical protein n=1 Tax=Sulfuricurvum sp. TaxID=2025608 RepID=UPI003561AEE7